jgi:hypothetical protein
VIRTKFQSQWRILLSLRLAVSPTTAISLDDVVVADHAATAVETPRRCARDHALSPIAARTDYVARR